MDERRQSGSGEPTARVLRFRPRTSETARNPVVAQADDADPRQDDFRHRMLVNAAGFACAVTLTAAGIWLASSMSDLRQKQDCVLTGRRDCAPVPAIDTRSQTSLQIQRQH